MPTKIISTRRETTIDFVRCVGKEARLERPRYTRRIHDESRNSFGVQIQRCALVSPAGIYSFAKYAKNFIFNIVSAKHRIFQSALGCGGVGLDVDGPGWRSTPRSDRQIESNSFPRAKVRRRRGGSTMMLDTSSTIDTSFLYRVRFRMTGPPYAASFPSLGVANFSNDRSRIFTTGILTRQYFSFTLPTRI